MRTRSGGGGHGAGQEGAGEPLLHVGDGIFVGIDGKKIGLVQRAEVSKPGVGESGAALGAGGGGDVEGDGDLIADADELVGIHLNLGQGLQGGDEVGHRGPATAIPHPAENFGDGGSAAAHLDGHGGDVLGDFLEAGADKGGLAAAALSRKEEDTAIPTIAIGGDEGAESLAVFLVIR
jgi:hypothetical protein